MVVILNPALVNSEEDMRGNHNDEDVNMNIDNEATAAERQRENALRAAKEMRRSLAIGGSADATTLRTQITFLCSDFEMYASNKQTIFPLSSALLDKGWNSLTRIAPTKFKPVDFAKSERVLEILKEKIQALPEDLRSTTTVHIHLCLEAVVFENLAIMLHESSVDARSNMESTLKRVYVQHIAEILKLVPRPPIVMINHDKRFFACAHKTLRRREDVVGYDAVGAYLALELRECEGAWWFMVPPSGARWSILFVKAITGHTFSLLETEPHLHHHKAFAMYEKQLFARR